MISEGRRLSLASSSSSSRVRGCWRGW
uniref:Uncharacterized protein n=1 Tax=Arundo donax TaxID=35708 RepID=A0A0A9BHX5_ARUDO